MVNRIHLLFVAALFFINASVGVAQDIHFSQFYMSPTNLNPALTGVMNCTKRIGLNYRNQWGSILKANAYNTLNASYDQKFTIGRDDYFGVGGTFWGDRAGELSFSTLQAKLSGSYSRKMGGYRQRAHYLSIGAEAGVSQRSINFLKARWGTQHDGNGGRDPNAPSLENNLDRNKFLFADFSAGLLWFSVFDDNKSFYAGAAFSHLNKPNQSFSDSLDVPLYNKITFHAGGDWALTQDIGLVPGIVTFFQGPSFELNVGTSVRFWLQQGKWGDESFQVGAWARLANKFIDPSKTGIHMDAIILSARFDYNDFGIGFSYDINTSRLKEASGGTGAFELSLVYKICEEEDRGVYCPTF